jgi:hypothetical protein
MNDISLENLIKQHVNLNNRSSSSGWWVCKCLVCNDYKKRAGFIFENNETSYNCFNCSIAAKHNPDEYSSISKKMIEVLDSFNIPEEEYRQISFNSLSSNKSIKEKDDKLNTTMVPISFPEEFILLEHATDVWATIANEYLMYDRKINPKAHPFYILDKEKQSKKIEKKWRGRLIIPYFRNKKIIWYQGRDLRPNSKLRYLNAQSESGCILSDYDILFNHTDKPLFILEGFFDAILLNGIAIFGNKIKNGQIELINRSNREKIYIPDITGKGFIAAKQALDLGWNVSVPDIGECKDINEAIIKYGKLYVMKTIMQNSNNGIKSQIRIQNMCK